MSGWPLAGDPRLRPHPLPSAGFELTARRSGRGSWGVSPALGALLRRCLASSRRARRERTASHAGALLPKTSTLLRWGLCPRSGDAPLTSRRTSPIALPVDCHVRNCEATSCSSDASSSQSRTWHVPLSAPNRGHHVPRPRWIPRADNSKLKTKNSKLSYVLPSKRFLLRVIEPGISDGCDGLNDPDGVGQCRLRGQG